MKPADSIASFTSATRPLYEVKAGLFKGLAHPVRVRILEVLSGSDEVPVGELIADTGVAPSLLSQHLGVLRSNRLVEAERRGSQVYYRLAVPQVAELLRVARSLLGDVLEAAQRQLDANSDLPDLPRAPEVSGARGVSMVPGVSASASKVPRS